MKRQDIERIVERQENCLSTDSSPKVLFTKHSQGKSRALVLFIETMEPYLAYRSSICLDNPSTRLG